MASSPPSSSTAAPVASPGANNNNNNDPQTLGVPAPASTSASGALQNTNETPTGIGAVEIDDFQGGDEDSTFGDGPGSDTASLTSSVLNHVYENGRRFHAYRDGQYALPNDETEQDRLDLLHHLHLLVLGGKLHLAPIKKDVGRVLDIGTGTGIWAMDFADEYPAAEVIGTDLSPIQPRWVPPNLKFEIDDAEATWTYPYKFDFIFLRTMGGSIKDVPRLLRQAYDNLNPGGWIEWHEYEAVIKSRDGPLDEETSHVAKYLRNLHEGARKFGKDLNIAPTIKPAIENAGFVEVEDKIYEVPIGPWAKDPKQKEIGTFGLVACIDAVNAYAPRLLGTQLGWRKEEIDVHLAQVTNEIKDRRSHLFAIYHFLYARKPKN